ncbi:MAG: LysM peptidoglycan-binding domain-containing protein [Epulopiscium sp.]|nr:LysM peptidoglycan-binding domain-containing protein [Candidatus Epulonipiscium sp.]
MDVGWNQDSKTVSIISPATVYQVKTGDTLWKIANQLNTTVGELKELNGIYGDMIYVGQELKINPNWQNQGSTPSNNSISYNSYKIRAGDTMWNLSIEHGIPMTELLKVNNMTENSSLSIGQIITIPVHHIALKDKVSEKHGEYLDWWSEAQYLFSIGKIATVTDFQTGKSFQIKRSTGAFHADCEPLTSKDAEVIKEIWGGEYSWKERAVIVQVGERKIAASMASMPHDVQSITDNNFEGHFDIHFRNSTRHKDGLISTAHQNQIQIAAGLK